MPELGDAPIEARYVEKMNAVARALDPDDMRVPAYRCRGCNPLG